ncbi:MAG TPA: hypothetical protein VLM05_13990 [Mycobacteriales bacterium]|nr:hypothetical protein [Mycobacteriales bacterium]
MGMGALQLELGDPDRLGELGLSVEVLHRAVRAGVEARATRTGLAPRNAAGTDLYSYTVEELRLLLTPAGWTADFAGGQERTVSPDGLTSIIFSTGVGPVGDPDPRATPRTAYAKGPLMQDAVTENLGYVQEEFPLGLRGTPEPGGRPLCWVLLVKLEPGRAQVELSVPDGMREGVVDSWAERIPLPPLPLGDPVDPGEPAVDLDVPVESRP